MEPASILVLLAAATVLMEIVTVLSRGPADYAGYLALLVGDFVVLGFTMVGQRWHDWPAWVGLAGAAALVLLPWVADRVMERLLRRGRLGAAAAVASLKELLAPGRAATFHREYLAEQAAARDGRIADVLRELRARLGAAEPGEASALQQRVVMALVAAGRRREATQHYETHLGRESPAEHPLLALQVVMMYVELGEMERAVELVRRLERTPLGGLPLPQVKLWLLAGAGEAELLDRVLAHEALGPLGAAERARLTALASARARAMRGGGAGDEAAADGGSVTGGAIDGVAAADGGGAAADGDAGQRERHGVESEVPGRRGAGAGASGADPLAPETRAYVRSVGDGLLATLAASAATRRARRRPGVTATNLLIVVQSAIWLLLVLGGRFDDGYDLVRAGAGFAAATRAGEWWRLVTAMFLHDASAPWHLVLNMLSLFAIGRLVEPALGAARFVLVYLVAGVAGNVLSLAMSGVRPRDPMSLGASGAVFGLVGALVVLLVLRRMFPGDAAVRRGMLLRLLLLIGLQLFFGTAVEHIDDAAHVGGGVAGLLVALLVGPGGVVTRPRLGRALVRVGLVASAAALWWAALSVSREDVARTIERIPTRSFSVGPVRITAPTYAAVDAPDKPDWPGQETLADRVAEMELSPHLVPLEADGVEGAIKRCVERDAAALERELLAEGKGRHVTLESARLPPVPGWQGTAQALREHPRRAMLYYARPEGAGRALVVEVLLLATERHRELRDAALARMLESATLGEGALPPTPPR